MQTEADTLEVVLEDPVSKVEVHLLYGVLKENDIITRAVKIVNRGEKGITLQKAASMNLDWIHGEYEWMTFYGGHVMERNVQRSKLGHGIHSIGSVRGTSSHHYNPFTIVSNKNTDEEKGGCYGIGPYGRTSVVENGKKNAVPYLLTIGKLPILILQGNS